jgi:hypothetical protein
MMMKIINKKYKLKFKKIKIKNKNKKYKLKFKKIKNKK